MQIKNEKIVILKNNISRYSWNHQYFTSHKIFTIFENIQNILFLKGYGIINFFNSNVYQRSTWENHSCHLNASHYYMNTWRMIIIFDLIPFNCDNSKIELEGTRDCVAKYVQNAWMYHLVRNSIVFMFQQTNA